MGGASPEPQTKLGAVWASRAAEQPSLAAQIAAAAGASLTAGLVVNPLDVVKTRLQAQEALLLGIRSTVPQALRSQTKSLHPLMDKWGISACSPQCFHDALSGRVASSKAASTSFCVEPGCEIYKSSWDVVRKVVRREGLRGLWKGTPEALLMAVPLVGIYMPVYEGILLYLSRRTSTGDIPAWGPLVAGSTSRMLSVVCVAPLELLRTQSQAFARGRPRKVRRPGVRPPSAWSWHRITRMWTGTSATLARDVPYSALYWSGVELLRSALSPSSGEASDAQKMGVSMVSGAVAGGLAAAVTTPLDVIKSRMQVAPLLSSLASAPLGSTDVSLAASGAPSGTGASIRVPSDPVSPAKKDTAGLRATAGRVFSEGGVKGFFTGWAPRALRAAPACAIVLGTYDGLKLALARA